MDLVDQAGPDCEESGRGSSSDRMCKGREARDSELSLWVRERKCVFLCLELCQKHRDHSIS